MKRDQTRLVIAGSASPMNAINFTGLRIPLLRRESVGIEARARSKKGNKSANQSCEIPFYTRIMRACAHCASTDALTTKNAIPRGGKNFPTAIFPRLSANGRALALDKRVASRRVAAKCVLAARCAWCSLLCSRPIASPTMIKQRPGNASCFLKKEKLPSTRAAVVTASFL